MWQDGKGKPTRVLQMGIWEQAGGRLCALKTTNHSMLFQQCLGFFFPLLGWLEIQLPCTCIHAPGFW